MSCEDRGPRGADKEVATLEDERSLWQHTLSQALPGAFYLRKERQPRVSQRGAPPLSAAVLVLLGKVPMAIAS